MHGEAWLKEAKLRIKQGGTIETVCVMGTAERLKLGLCSGVIPVERARRGSNTCSPGCQEHRRALQRAMLAEKQCRLCGRGLTKKQREEAVRKAQEAGHDTTDATN